MAHRQTLVQAVHLALTGRDRALGMALGILDGTPVGGAGETVQAYRQLRDLLPARRNRTYTADQFSGAVWATESGRHVCRTPDEIRREAAAIEASTAALTE